MKKIKFLVMDVDGTLTDGKIYMGNDGEMMKAFDIKDGCGIHDLLIPSGIVPVILTGRGSSILLNRCKELGIRHVFQNVQNKQVILKKFVENEGNTLADVAYIGDDINDLLCMKLVKVNQGIVGCPFDAVDEVKQLSDFVSAKRGGDGAVREFIDYLVKI